MTPKYEWTPASEPPDTERSSLIQRVAEMIDYDPHTGKLTWKRRDVYVRGWSNKRAGEECGKLRNGYRVIEVRFGDGVRLRVMAHRLAWFIHCGRLPNGEIDHVNRDRSDNRACNLREVSSSMNKRNKSRMSNNKSGVTGVCWDKCRKKWAAQVRMEGRNHHLGRFDNLIDADLAVRRFRANNGFSESHGEPPAKETER